MSEIFWKMIATAILKNNHDLYNLNVKDVPKRKKVVEKMKNKYRDLENT
ncbi:hypothetical protein IW492_02575 [Enterococcus sp. BWB1-3]|nr:hypothetical protein [Enterococcus sp. BWB1-3]MBL1228116.1 hypothetical protein [Enterococcus sp. BWB1-3]